LPWGGAEPRRQGWGVRKGADAEARWSFSWAEPGPLYWTGPDRSCQALWAELPTQQLCPECECTMTGPRTERQEEVKAMVWMFVPKRSCAGVLVPSVMVLRVGGTFKR
jgi:hypothetical protein